jgi:hypothetical protein
VTADDAPLYLYGVADAPLDGSELGPGLAGAAVAALPVAGFTALVGPAPPEPVEATRRHMLAHTAVLERAMRQADCLPIRFGTVAPGRAALERCLAAQGAAFRDALASVRGRVELGVKAQWHEGLIWKEIVEGDAELRALRDRLRTRPAGETYYERIELGRRVEGALAKRREADAAAIVARLAPLADREVELRAVEQDMILNRAFLVRREVEGAFDAAMAELGERLGERVSFRYVGPAPPYNFVALRADWMRATA